MSSYLVHRRSALLPERARHKRMCAYGAPRTVTRARRRHCVLRNSLFRLLELSDQSSPTTHLMLHATETLRGRWFPTLQGMGMRLEEIFCQQGGARPRAVNAVLFCTTNIFIIWSSVIQVLDEEELGDLGECFSRHRILVIVSYRWSRRTISAVIIHILLKN
jgi:hypothetical protein